MAEEGSTNDVKDTKPTLNEQFLKFAKFGNSAKTTMTTTTCNKMLRESKITSPGSKYTSTDVDIAFSKVKEKTKKEINFKEFKSLLDELAKKDGGLGVDELTTKLTSSSGPGAKGTTKPVKSAVVDHLTDTSQYTGSHKQRFDGTGKGKGLQGRKDVPDTSGYVSGYKEKGSYDNKVAK